MMREGVHIRHVCVHVVLLLAAYAVGRDTDNYGQQRPRTTLSSSRRQCHVSAEIATPGAQGVHAPRQTRPLTRGAHRLRRPSRRRSWRRLRARLLKRSRRHRRPRPSISSRRLPVKSYHKYVAYHGTSCFAASKIKSQGFVPSAQGMLGPGVYLSRDIRKTFVYAISHGRQFGNNGCVVKTTVDVGKVITITRQGAPLQQTWMKKGYDSAWVPPNSLSLNPSGREELCVKNPKKIRVLKVCSYQQAVTKAC